MADGVLYWKERTEDMFNRRQDMLAWNAKHAGKPLAHGSSGGNWYKTVTIGEDTLGLHRLIYMYYNNIQHYNDVPETIDHFDRDRRNNDPENLVDGTSSINSRNRVGIGFSKYKGVDFVKCKDKYRSRIIINFREVHLGLFTSEEVAAKFYDTANNFCGLPSHFENGFEYVELPIKTIKKLQTALAAPAPLRKESSLVGVCWNMKQQKFNAIIRVNSMNKTWCAGSFDSEVDAAIARNNFIIENKLPCKLTEIQNELLKD